MLTHRDFLRRSASSYGQRPAFRSPSGQVMTHAELDAASTRLANTLLERGLGPGDRMVWLDYNSIDFYLAYFATAKIGMAFSPLNYWLRAHELRPLIELVGPQVFVARDEFVGLASSAMDGLDVDPLRISLGKSVDGWLHWSELRGSETPIGNPVDENDLHEIVFTSGTTGQSKGVMRSQRKRILDGLGAALGFQLNRDDHMLFFLPQFHIGGAAEPLQVILQGGQVTVLKRFQPEAVAEAIGAGVTYIVGVPAHYNLLFESGCLDGVDTTQVRGCYVGGSAARREMFDEILARFPSAELVHGYGSTESGPHTMALRGRAFLDHFGALGLPVLGTRVRVVTDGRDVEQGEIGELWVDSEAVMDGYLGRPDLSAAAFCDGWLRTGDLVTQDGDGFFHMVDRLKDLIITGGENVYPHEVEDVLSTHPSVAEVAVIGVPDAIYEERVVAVVRLHPDQDPIDESGLIAYVRERLAGFKTPRQIHLVDELPRTGVGKLAKAALRQQYAPSNEPAR